MSVFLKTILLLFVLLNPFLIIVYLVDVIKKQPSRQFGQIMLRAGIISYCVFSLFALLGDSLFNEVINARFESFQIFGGVIFLIIAIQFVFKGSSAIKSLRGESRHIAGAIAMPILVGPGTISYSVLIGKKLSWPAALLSIGITVFSCVAIVFLLKLVYDRIHQRKEELVEKYFELAGRVTALIIGTIAIEMIMLGLGQWLERY